VNWQTYPGAPTSGFWDMDTLNGKLYVSTGLVQEFDGSTWTVTANYNNSSNTGNKTKSCIKTINGKLYAGAKDFNTSGQGTIHYLSSGTWSLQQNTNFAYNGSNKIRGFELYNSEIYTCGLFSVPGSSTFKNVAKWNGNDWVDVGRNFGFYPPTTEVKAMQAYQGKLYLTEGNSIWSYDGNNWDSIVSASNSANVFPMGGGINDLEVYNGELYMSGNFALSSSNYGILLLKYNGSSFNAVTKNDQSASAIISAGTYTTVGRMGVVGGKLYFFAKKTSDNNVYLVSYNGTSLNEIGKVGDYGDYTIAPGYEINTFQKILAFNSDLVIGGTFTKVNGMNLPCVAYIPGAVGFAEFENKLHLNVYPNPSAGQIKINAVGVEKFDLVIKNMLGQTIQIYLDLKNNDEVNTGLPSGAYFCSAVLEGKVILSQKLIIQ
jgi:hypothetical protein